MSWAEDIYSTLSGAAGVSALVSTRISPQFAEQSEALPYITYDLIGNLPANHLEDIPTLDERRIQVNSYADTYRGAVDLAEAVRTALQPLGYLALEIDLPRDFDSRTYAIAQDWVIYFSRS